jgi:hypothetical protein
MQTIEKKNLMEKKENDPDLLQKLDANDPEWVALWMSVFKTN